MAGEQEVGGGQGSTAPGSRGAAPVLLCRGGASEEGQGRRRRGGEAGGGGPRLPRSSTI